MKKIFFAVGLAVLLFTACDGVNQNIDDLARTLRISVKVLQDTEDTWKLTEDVGQVVSASQTSTIGGTVGSVTVTAGAKDTFVRSDKVTVLAADVNGTDDLIFAYWLLPARTDEDRDPLSTEGNIRYDIDGDGETVSLRTDYEQSEIYAVFARDGVTPFGALNFDNVYEDDNTTEFSFELAPVSDITLYGPRFRIFDDQGEARMDWQDFYDISSTNETVTITSTAPLTIKKKISGMKDIGVLDDWTVAILYEDADGNVYVVK